MYNLSHFKAKEEGEVMAFMKAHPFITLCGSFANGKPVATHIPALLVERDNKLFLQAHIMRKQEHHLAFAENEQVLAIFQGAHTYVSASWYEQKNIASTWNYRAVHVNGQIAFKDEAWLLQLLTDLTSHFENNPHSPALVNKMDPAYVQQMMKAIIGFEVEVTNIQHVFKTSQNREGANYKSIVDHLTKADDAGANEMAEIMKKDKA
jgi:transcriptional regulator